MGNFFARQYSAYSRELRRSCETLLGICAGLLADQGLNEQEVLFLDQWLKENDAIADVWPGEMIAQRVRHALADGVVTDDELQHLQATLRALLGGTLEETGAASGLSTKLPLDDVADLVIRERRFCLTGEFVYGPRSKCESAITERGGDVLERVRKDLDYLVIGTLVSAEWKHSSFGTKIQKAVEYRGKGVPLLIVSEKRWTGAL